MYGSSSTQGQPKKTCGKVAKVMSAGTYSAYKAKYPGTKGGQISELIDMITKIEALADSSANVGPPNGLQRCRVCDRATSIAECDRLDQWEICDTDRVSFCTESYHKA